MSPPISLVVLYVADLEASLRFYSACGLSFEEEQHGSGPRHYSAVLAGGAVFELHPAAERPTSRTRLGFCIADISAVLNALSVLAGCAVSEPRDLEYGRVRVTRDPDGNAVELVEPPDRGENL